MVRGEILPSAWILQPVTMGGKEITRVIYLAQVILASQHVLEFVCPSGQHLSVAWPFA